MMQHTLTKCFTCQESIASEKDAHFYKFKNLFGGPWELKPRCNSCHKRKQETGF